MLPKTPATGMSVRVAISLQGWLHISVCLSFITCLLVPYTVRVMGPSMGSSPTYVGCTPATGGSGLAHRRAVVDHRCSHSLQSGQ